MRQQRYEVESLGPVVREIEKRQKRLKAIRAMVAKHDQKSLDLRLQALEESRQILAKACKTAPKMNAYFEGATEE
jgi:DNA-binding HxlR family transcriptional regulator